MARSKGQASMEYIMIFGCSLIVVGILWLTSSNDLQNARWELQLSYAKNAAEKIVQTVDTVYVQGYPAQLYVNVDLPENLRAVYLENNAINIELDWRGIPRNITVYTITNLTGSIGPSPGRHKLLVTAGNPVNISEA